MSVCRNCGFEFDGRYCPECGTKYVPMQVCGNCGTEFMGNFCPECGTKYSELRICRSCGQEVTGRFCTKCGTKYEEFSEQFDDFNPSDVTLSQKIGGIWVENVNSDIQFDGLAFTPKGEGYSVRAVGNIYETSLIIPAVHNGKPVVSVDAHSFYEYASLTSVVIPDGVTEIRYYAFCGCTSLSYVVIPKSVTSIGSYAFSRCLSLKKIFYFGDESDWRKISVLAPNPLSNATLYCYREIEPSEEGSFWHFDVDGEPVPW